MDDVISKLAEIEAAASRIMENVAEQKKVLSLENEEKMKAFDEETDKETENWRSRERKQKKFLKRWKNIIVNVRERWPGSCMTKY